MKPGLGGLLLALALALPAQAVPHEAVFRAPVVAGVEQAYIDVTVFRPEGPGPFPLVVLSHGSPRLAEERRAEGRLRLAAQSERFVAMGFAVLVPTRRGYGRSGGHWAEGYGSCSNPDYYRAGLETARDMRAAVDAVRSEPWADASQVVLAGQSAGGFGSVAASATPFAGLVGVINFAGGRGSRGPDDVCGEAKLVEAMARYGGAARVPELWIYSSNDRYFGPALARRMHHAFVQNGGAAEFVEAPPTGLDGHGYFAAAMDDWSPRVARFLERVVAKR
ncbi:MAG TPA: CocE/NonD family hydrolase [Usitatibacter sp.]|nr:CocE/NonD family hydrolase [Usitatibacter sp.]